MVIALPAGFSLWATPNLKLVVIANQASKNVSDLVLPAPKTPAIASVDRPDCKADLQGFFQQSGRRANAETAVKVAGATAKHCIVLHGKSNFLSGTSRGTDFDHECYTRANVAYSRATDLTVSACPVNMHGATGMSQVLSALLHGVCTLCTNDQQTVKVRVEGEFSASRKLVSESTAAFFAATEPQPLWTGSLPVCLVEYHQGHPRRLRLVLASQSLLTNGEKSLLDAQHPVHGKVHNSGLLFGYAADRCTEPDWLVLPDGHQPNAWKLLHAARKGGNRFCVGSGLRYAPGQADDTANRAKEYQFESLHKIYFYDAWRWKIELNQPESSLHLPPRPGLLQNGCYWQQPMEHPENAAHLHHSQPSAALAEISLTETSSDESDEAVPPSEAPEPTSQGRETEPPASPITICSTEEENVSSRNNATEPSDEEVLAETVASISEGGKTQEESMEATPKSPSTNVVTRTAESREQMEGEQAEETESVTTDEVIDLEVLGEATPERAASSRYESMVTKRAQAATQSLQPQPAPPPPAGATSEMEKTGTKCPASIASLQETDERQAPPDHARAGTNEVLKREGGHRVAALMHPPQTLTSPTSR